MKSTIAVALSGGIDSLVAAHLLIQKGHRVIGVHFLTGFERFHPGDECDTAVNAAKNRIAPLSAQLRIPVEVVDLSAEFQCNVIDYFVRTYQSGQTPNPCLVCNPVIKFDLLAGYVRKLGAHGLATGHYACRKKNETESWQLYKGKDPQKDQSYFLARLTQAQLAFAHFPLGAMEKKETIRLAQEKGLTPIVRNESQDICFINGGDYGEFLLRQPGFNMLPGPIEDVAGNIIGTHPGLHRFTIGQRRGINCPAAEPYYVVRLEPERNCLVVGYNTQLSSTGCMVTHINWIDGVPVAPFKAHVRVRYRHREVPATIIPENDTTAVIQFEIPQKAITPGQGAVFYQNDQVLGGGWITTPLT